MVHIMRIWNNEISTVHLTEESISYLKSLPKELPKVEWVWEEMDRVWDSLQLDNRKSFKDQKIAEFYSHPLWLMNGFFTHSDPISNYQRKAIANFLNNADTRQIADFGGGFGELAIAISNTNRNVSVDIIEPFPSKFGIERISNYANIHMVQELGNQEYDAIIAQDVLEHVEDPILNAFEIASSLRCGGQVIFANCFYPVIKCHLPSNFHLRYSFPIVMQAMGMKYQTKVQGAEHALVFVRGEGRLNINAARKAEYFSKLCHPLLNNSREFLSKIKKFY